MPTTKPAKNPPRKSAAPKQHELALKPRRLEQIARSKQGKFSITPTLITPEPGFNERTDYGDLAMLAADILANGLIQPLIIRKIEGSETIHLVDGHRRHAAILSLIKSGDWPADPEDPALPAPIACISSPRNASPVDLLYIQLSANTGKNLTLLEKSRIYARILTEDPSLTGVDIAKRIGETKQAVSDALRLRDATPPLLLLIEEGRLAPTTALVIIKQAATQEGQYKLMETAIATAAAAGRPDHIMPKDVPAPPGPVESWRIMPAKRQKKSDPLVWLGNTSLGGPIQAPHGFFITGFASNSENIAFGWEALDDGGFKVCYNLLNRPHTDKYSLLVKSPRLTSLDSALDGFMAQISEGWRLDHADLTLVRGRICKAFPEFLPQSTPGTPASGIQTPDTDTDTADDTDTANEPAALSTAFQLYQIPDAPADPDEDGTYHESERLVLESFPPGITRLHLLTALTPHGPAYGFRIDDASGPKAVAMPREDHRTTGSEPVTGLFAMITEACATVDLQPGVADTLAAQLKDAIIRYYQPADGHDAEEPALLSFVAIPKASTPDPGAVDRIKSAGSSNRDGSGVSLGNDGGFKSCDDQAEKLNKILEDLAESGHPARMETANLIYNFLTNETSTAAIKNHLKGK